ncbi:MAG: transposase, partial [Bacteroidales bacterium]|nr:transposase [Bacteroidales bacterium]
MFYTVIDFLVFFSIFCISAKKHEITVLGLCPMFDHLHALTRNQTKMEVRSFVQAYSSLYARELNTNLGTKGSVFHRQFGFARKKGDKAVRTAYSYLYNNPGEKRLCHRAEEYRWTFLAYAVSVHPFSEKIQLRFASGALRKALKMIDYYSSRDIYLRHSWLEKMFSPLNEKEKQQLVDYIIAKYNVIDYEALISLYGSYEKACLAFASNQGSEYDIAEEFSPESHRAYLEISQTLLKKHGLSKIKDAIRLPLDNR